MKDRKFDVNSQDYIEVVLNEYNIFNARASFEILGKQLFDVDVKVDTGSNYSSLSALTIGFTEEEALELKKKDYNDKNIEWKRERNAGTTETQKRESNIWQVCGCIEKVKNILFSHTAHNITIAGMYIEDMNFGVSYDTNRPILLGMDVLKQFDIHIHKTEDDKTILLACPLYYMSEKYKQAVIDLMQH